MSKNTNHDRVKEITVEKMESYDVKYLAYRIKVRTGTSKLYQKDILIEDGPGVAAGLRTIAHFLEFMSDAIKKKDGGDA
jgi:hypothetical protein